MVWSFRHPLEKFPFKVRWAGGANHDGTTMNNSCRRRAVIERSMSWGIKLGYNSIKEFAIQARLLAWRHKSKSSLALYSK